MHTYTCIYINTYTQKYKGAYHLHEDILRILFVRKIHICSHENEVAQAHEVLCSLGCVVVHIRVCIRSENLCVQVYMQKKVSSVCTRSKNLCIRVHMPKPSFVCMYKIHELVHTSIHAKTKFRVYV